MRRTITQRHFFAVIRASGDTPETVVQGATIVPPLDWELVYDGTVLPRTTSLTDLPEHAVLDLWPAPRTFVVLYLESGINPQTRALLAGVCVRL